MPPQELMAQLQRRPFHPFRLVMTDGTVYEVRHPEMLLLTPRAAHIGYPDPEEPGMAQHVDIISLVQVLRIEEAEPAQG